jgi:hypothetical protein
VHDWRFVVVFILVAVVVAGLRLLRLRRELADRQAWLAELAARQQERAERQERAGQDVPPPSSLREWLEQSGLSNRLTVVDGRLHAIRQEEWW